VDIQLVVAAHARVRAGEFDGEIAGGGERYLLLVSIPGCCPGNDAVGSDSADCARPSKGAATINQNGDLGCDPLITILPLRISLTPAVYVLLPFSVNVPSPSLPTVQPGE